jgi:hypothetical protein
MNDWQPIETAPKGDDDLFLVCSVGDDRGPFVIGGRILWNARNGNAPSHLRLHYLTHWMQIPEPPSQSKD